MGFEGLEVARERLIGTAGAAYSRADTVPLSIHPAAPNERHYLNSRPWIAIATYLYGGTNSSLISQLTENEKLTAHCRVLPQKPSPSLRKPRNVRSFARTEMSSLFSLQPVTLLNEEQKNHALDCTESHPITPQYEFPPLRKHLMSNAVWLRLAHSQRSH
jgi:hypothetical protein